MSDCPVCGKAFVPRPARGGRARQRYCSQVCFHLRRGGFLERFWARVEVTDSCWLWRGRCGNTPYGQIGIRYNQVVYAHRLSFELATREPVPPGLFVLHRCDTPRCVRPDHLFLGTLADNSADCIAKGRVARGERNGTSALTDDQVLRIRARYVPGRVKQRDLAREFGVTQATVGRVVRGELWRHVTAAGRAALGGQA